MFLHYYFLIFFIFLPNFVVGCIIFDFVVAFDACNARKLPSWNQSLRRRASKVVAVNKKKYVSQKKYFYICAKSVLP